MSLFAAALDYAAKTKQFGENGHSEIAPVPKTIPPTVDIIKEKIVQFQFQCVRCTKNVLETLADSMRDILRNIEVLKQQKQQDQYTQCLVTLYKIIGQTRDIESGKGERQISYMMVSVLYEFYPELAKFAVLSFIKLNNTTEGTTCLPYGSWKDMKRLCQYVYETTNEKNSPLISYCIDLMINQLREDQSKTDDSELSLCARWVPRESSTKGKWIFRLIAEAYYPEFITSALGIKDQEKREKSYKAAKSKTYMTFARMVSSLNKRLDTVQIKMCGKRWAEIDHHKTTSVTLMKSRNAFMNKSKKRSESTELDRIECAENFEHYITTRVKEGKEVKGKRVGLVDFVKQGIELSYSKSQLEKDTLNSQWRSFMTQVGDLGNMVAMVDQSGSMSGDPMHAAMGMGIAVASKSALGKRVMTFSSDPEWVSLEECDTFVSYINKLQTVSHLAGFGTNFFRALKMILDACIEGKVPNEVVTNMTLAIFSDMQIDYYTNSPDDQYYSTKTKASFEDSMLTMHERIEKMYIDAGYSGVPHILFWNLRHTRGFPTLSTMKNATMFSGFSPMLLNAFCEKGREALQQTNPWDALIDSLSNPRYDILGEQILTI